MEGAFQKQSIKISAKIKNVSHRKIQKQRRSGSGWLQHPFLDIHPGGYSEGERP